MASVIAFLCVDCAYVPLGPAAGKDDAVILLHGLGRSERSMRKLGKYLAAREFKVTNLDYPSQKHSVERLAEIIEPAIKKVCAETPGKVHFVTHSMGGILVRYFLGQKDPGNLGRVVMLSPPNKGSEAVDHLNDLKLYRLLNGPAGLQLGTKPPDSLPIELGPVDFELGVITGTRTFFTDLILSYWIPGEDDGKVSVESAKVEGMQDFLTVPVSHPFIMKRRIVIDQIIHFLETGRFFKKGA